MMDNYKKDASKAVLLGSPFSPRIIKKMAAAYHFKYEEILYDLYGTQSKVMELQGDGYTVLLYTNQSNKFRTGAMLNESDSFAFSISFTQLYSKICSEGLSLGKYLDSIYTKYGFYHSECCYYSCSDSFQSISIVINNIQNIKTLIPLTIEEIKEYNGEADSKTNFLASSTYVCKLHLSNGALCAFKISRNSIIKFYIEGWGYSYTEAQEMLSILKKDIKKAILPSAGYKLMEK
jgi:hypothetical protein